MPFFSLYSNICGLQSGPGKIFHEGPGKSRKSPGFFASKRAGTLPQGHRLMTMTIAKRRRCLSLATRQSLYVHTVVLLVKLDHRF